MRDHGFGGFSPLRLYDSTTNPGEELPPGKARADVEAACYTCHSAEKKTPIVDYLAKHFGPGNRFVPTRVRAGKS